MIDWSEGSSRILHTWLRLKRAAIYSVIYIGIGGVRFYPRDLHNNSLLMKHTGELFWSAAYDDYGKMMQHLGDSIRACIQDDLTGRQFLASMTSAINQSHRSMSSKRLLGREGGVEIVPMASISSDSLDRYAAMTLLSYP